MSSFKDPVNLCSKVVTSQIACLVSVFSALIMTSSNSCHLWHGSGGVIPKNRKFSINYWFLRPCTHNLVKMQILGNFK